MYAREECGCRAIPIVSQCKPNFGSDASSHELQSSMSFHCQHLCAEWKMPVRCFASRYPVTACAQTACKRFFLQGPDLDLSASPSVGLHSLCWDNSSFIVLHSWRIPKYIIFENAVQVWLVLFRAVPANSQNSVLGNNTARYFGILILTQDWVSRHTVPWSI